MIRHKFYIAMALVAAMTVATSSCSDDEEEILEIVEEEETETETESEADDTEDTTDTDEVGDTIEVRSIEFDYTTLDEGTESYDSDDNDYQENNTYTREVTFTFSDSSVSCSGDTDQVTIDTDGAHVTVTSTKKNFNYILTGSSSDGSFKIYSDNKFKITLDGVSLTNPSGAAINNQCGKSLYIVLADGSVNSLSDGTSYDTVDGEDMKGTIFSEGQILFSGSGTLDVNANCKAGIVSDDYLLFRPGNVINVTSTAGNGIKANDGITIRGGVLNIAVSADGAYGISSESLLEVSGGRTTIITSGASEIADADTVSSAGIKADTIISVTAGIVRIKATGEGGKGINCSSDINFAGDELSVVTTGEKTNSSPKGIKAKGQLTISGGNIYSYSANSSPLDISGDINVADGYSTYTDTERLFEVEY